MRLKIDFSNIKTTLKGSNLAPSGIDVTVKEISKRDTKYGEKLVLGFHENNSEMFVNKTQLKTMLDLFGNNADEWINKSLHLTKAPTERGPTIVIRSNNNENVYQ